MPPRLIICILSKQPTGRTSCFSAAGVKSTVPRWERRGREHTDGIDPDQMLIKVLITQVTHRCRDISCKHQNSLKKKLVQYNSLNMGVQSTGTSGGAVMCPCGFRTKDQRQSLVEEVGGSELTLLRIHNLNQGSQ